MTHPVMTVQDLQAFLRDAFSQNIPYLIEHVGPREARLRLPFHDEQKRPGGTISGPTQMALADVAAYGVILAHIGPEAMAVTSHLSIDFLRKPGPRDLLATARLARRGRRLAVCQVALLSDGDEEPVAIAQITYSLPEKAG